MIGTDFHPGIRGIGPKTGLKLIRQHLTIEKVCEFKEIDVPDNLEEIREIFLNHPASTGHELDLKPINTDALREWLAERDFSEGRIERNLEKINKTANIRKSGQASLFDY
jgi:flap endonuclease-1